jgi:hypothetical protein
MTDTVSLHCKACDRLFSPVWHKDRGCFEELCWICLPLALGYEPSDDLSEVSDLLGLELDITKEMYNE